MGIFFCGPIFTPVFIIALTPDLEKPFLHMHEWYLKWSVLPEKTTNNLVILFKPCALVP